MSNVTRYDFDKIIADDMAPAPDGEYVRYEDYKAVADRLDTALGLVREVLTENYFVRTDEEDWERRAEALLGPVVETGGFFVPGPPLTEDEQRRLSLVETSRPKCDDCGEEIRGGQWCGCADIGRPENWRTL